MGKRTPLRASFIVAALASTAALSEAPGARAPRPSAPPGEAAALAPEAAEGSPAERGFAVDSRGRLVRSTMGDCIATTVGGSIAGLPECGAVVARATTVTRPMPSAEAPPAQPRQIPLGRVSLDADTTFNFDSAVLSEEGRYRLDEIVEASKGAQVDRLRIHITGYADRIGPADYNRSLSEQRAMAVEQYFVKAGIPAEIITVEGRGESNPVVQCEGMEGVALVECLRPNRRSDVEFAALEQREEAVAEQPSRAPGEPEPWAPATDTGTPR